MIIGKSSTNHAEIHWAQDKKRLAIVPLHLVPKENSLWYCAVTFPQEPIEFPTKYTYCLQEFTNAIPGKDQPKMVSTQCKEKEKRTVKYQFQFDVFIFPDSRHRHGETTQSAVIWYTQWLFKFVDDSTIPPILTYIQGLNLTSVNENHIKELVSWILEQASRNSTTDIQRFYLCKIVIMCHPRNLSRYVNSNKIACDRLLDCFSTSVHSKFFSKSDLEQLKKIALIFVENSSTPGWFTLAVHFYPYLGIQFLTDNKQLESLSHQYDSEKYQELVTALFSCLKVDNQDQHQNLLTYVMKSAPKLVDALDLYQRSKISEVFSTEDKKVEFFAEFFFDTYVMSEKEKSLWERLVVFHHMPQKIRKKFYSLLYRTLLKYAKSDDKLKDEDIEVLVVLMLFIKQLDMGQFLDVLKEFSTSKSLSRQDLLLQILNNQRFKGAWLEISLDTKVNICKSWVMNRVTVKYEIITDKSEIVVLIYQSIEDIMQYCSLNASTHRTLVKNVYADLAEFFLESIDAIDVLQAFESIDKLPLIVKEFYISHIKRILTPELVKNSSQILNKCSTIR